MACADVADGDLARRPNLSVSLSKVEGDAGTASAKQDFRPGKCVTWPPGLAVVSTRSSCAAKHSANWQVPSLAYLHHIFCNCATQSSCWTYAQTVFKVVSSAPLQTVSWLQRVLLNAQVEETSAGWAVQRLPLSVADLFCSDLKACPQ